MAKMDEEEAIEESRRVTTLENTDPVIERGETANNDTEIREKNDILRWRPGVPDQ